MSLIVAPGGGREPRPARSDYQWLQILQQLAVPSPREHVRPAYRLPVASFEVCSSSWLSRALRQASFYANDVAQTSVDVVKL